MTAIKMCGLSQKRDIQAVNEIKPEYIGFVFWAKSKRYISPEKALEFTQMLDENIKAVGVFVDESIENVAELLENGVIDLAQLHGSETEDYIHKLREMTDKPIIKAFKIRSLGDVERAVKSCADIILLDAGMGDGKIFDWSLIQDITRPYFLAGGLNCENIAEAVRKIKPYAVDVSSGIETDGLKDIKKMTAFAMAVRKEDEL